MSKLKVGMISFAHGHAFSYLDSLLSLPEVELVGIADPVESRVSDIASRHALPYYSDYRQLLDQDVDAVVICSENALHAEITIAAANKGKHVLCTAPGGWFVDPKLSGGGALLDHTVHVMDLMNWFTGSEVKEVYAYAATLFNDKLDVDDAGMLHVKFENGVFGVLDTSWSRKPPYPTWGDVALEIIGTQGVVSVNGFAQINELYSSKVGSGQWNYWGDNMDQRMIHDFVKAILSGQSVPITGEDGMRSTLAALAGYQSIKEKQPVCL